VNGILADVNIEGYVDALVALMQAEPWRLFWDHLRLRYLYFADVGLAADAPDSLVWETCQREQWILITDNRNRKDADSLEATIQARNTPSSLPVFTIGNVARLRGSRDYADRIIDKLLDSLLRIDALRGTGRLFLP
jgi:hypothetical protein